MPVRSELVIKIPGIPKARQSTRVAAITNKAGDPVYNYHEKNGQISKSIKIGKFQTKESENDYAYLKWSMVQQRGFNFKLWANPVIVYEARYVFPFTKGNRNLFKPSKPDLVDNLNKMTFDAMKGILIVDDAQVVAVLNSIKIFGDEPMIYLHLIELSDNISY